MLSYSTTIETAIISAIALYLLHRYVQGRNTRALPPGPPGRFLIGNLQDMPLGRVWDTFTAWNKRYGPVVYLDIAGQPLVILGTYQAAVELLDKRAAIYSDRPRFVMAAELCGYTWGTAFMRSSNPTWKLHRKFLSQNLHPHIVQRDYVPLQERAAHKLAKALIDDPDSFADQIHRKAAEITQTLAYGSFTDDDGTDLVALATTNIINVFKAFTGYAVDLIPLLKYVPSWVPGAKFKREAKEWRLVDAQARWQPFNMVKRRYDANEAMPPSFTLSLLEAHKAQGASQLNADVMSGMAATLFGAASDTLAGTVTTFMLAMTLYPDVQARARAELHRVVGADRMPTLADKDSLPYLDAVIKETMRWHTVAPAGVPHRLTQDDEYDGHLIPEGSTVMVNVWGILHDERRFPNPDVFDPDRWLTKTTDNTDSDSSLIDPWNVIFGYGRRICPGIAFARPGLWIPIATILSSLEIKQRINPKTGSPIVPKAEWTGTSTSFPEPFVCDIQPISRGRIDLNKEAVAEDEKVHGNA